MTPVSEYNKWLEHGFCNVNTDKQVINECFSKNLHFGTGGIRAIMGLDQTD